MKGTRRLYLELERQMLRLDDEGDEELADRIRDLMDFVWFQRFSPEDRRVLNARGSVERNHQMEWLYEDPASPTEDRLEEPLHAEVPYLSAPPVSPARVGVA
jgi:hypothetical protein